MKLLVLAMLPLVASADDCILKGGFAKLEVTCTIPSVTQISSECCSNIQGAIDDSSADQEPPSPEEQQKMQQECMDFQMYVMGLAPREPQPQDPVEAALWAINALPDGLKCTEKIAGAAKSACQLHTKFGKLESTCEIPEETTITPECCDAVQGSLDKADKADDMSELQDVGMEEAQETMAACASVQAYGQEHMPAPAPDASPPEQAAAIIDSIAPGTSCTQAISGGDRLSTLAKNTVLSKIALAAGVVKHAGNEVSAMPLVGAGVVGFLAGGLIVTGVLSRFSKGQHDSQYSLLAAEAA